MRQLVLTMVLATSAIFGADKTDPPAEAKPDYAALCGSYYFGDGLGVNCTLELKPGGQFSFNSHGCCGTYDENTGTAELKDGTLHLTLAKANNLRGIFGVAEKYRVARWGERIYLLTDDGMLDFCNAVNQGHEPREERHGYAFFLRDKDWVKPAPGLPDLPKQWLDYLLKQPLRGKVEHVNRDGTARLSLGSKDGLKVGMVLTAQGERYTQLVITAVEDASCTVKHSYKDDAADEHYQLKPGQLVTSRSFDK